ncbi:hypothetical protein [Brasilonema bromeliae]|uniref:Uncharacterized protein n=1 Tax=Brasilonema bromeliae SPC951 TaxID=385972 RepID=A0ABX1P2F2_9CYAN|nr:hypothetical protein [Brasilonema bromeliae]NMG18198.1 hypothetical protein [Brasilonema bromeliae SPC951]
MFHRHIVSACLLVSGFAVSVQTAYAQTPPVPSASARVATSYNNPLYSNLPITVFIETVSSNNSPVNSEYTCVGVAPGAIFSQLTCGVPGGSQLTGGSNGSVATVGPIIVGKNDATICWAGKFLFAPNKYAYQSGCSTPKQIVIDTQAPANPAAPPVLPNLPLPGLSQ